MKKLIVESEQKQSFIHKVSDLEVYELEQTIPRPYVDGFSRYRFLPVLEVSYQKFLDLPYFPDIYDLRPTNTFTVTLKEENRIDKLSYFFYGTTYLWWVLCLYNRISNPFDLPIQTKILAPSLDDLYRNNII